VTSAYKQHTHDINWNRSQSASVAPTVDSEQKPLQNISSKLS